MFTLGFDVAKDHHDVALTNKSGRLKQRWYIPNSIPDVTKLLEDTQKEHRRLVIGCEATGSYHLTVVRVALQLGIPCRVLNPLTTKQYTKSTVRGRKTDRDDALSIARLVSRGEGSMATMDSLSSSRNYVRLATKAKQHIHALRLEKVYLQELGITSDPGYEQVVSKLEELVLHLREQAKLDVNPKSVELLTSIVGIGPTLAISLIAEIGDIQRFTLPKQLVAYAGLDPRVRQSGTVLNRNTKLTKRGSSELRNSLFLAANIARQHDPELKSYYQKKRNEGRTYTEATVATARKVANRVFAVLKRGTPYIKCEKTT